VVNTFRLPLTLAMGSLLIFSWPTRAESVFVSDYVEGTVIRYDPDGRSSVYASGLANPYAMAFDQGGNLYVAEDIVGSIVRISASGDVSVFASGLPALRALAFDNNNNLYVATGNSPETSSIMMFNPSGRAAVFDSGQSDPLLDQPQGLAFDAQGNLYASTLNGGIERFSAAGPGILFASGVYTSLASDNAGGIYATHAFTVDVTNFVQAIEHFGPDGSISRFAVCSNYVVSIAAGYSGYVYGGLGNRQPSGVVVFDPDGEQSFLALGFGDARGIAVLIPEPSLFAVALPGMGFLLVSVVRSRRSLAVAPDPSSRARSRPANRVPRQARMTAAAALPPA
jgi:hypothetical protein